MFGEEVSESPRLPSPWRNVSSSSSSLVSPSPLTLTTPTSIPSTPQPCQQRPSPPPLADNPLDSLLSSSLDALDGFEALSMDDDEPEDSAQTSFEDEEGTQIRRGSETGLSPEVDHCGHIEYKLKLPPPSPLRLAKLVTQLKWRLVEGGGMALYELGILDNGTLVGLPKADMGESLETLGTMLACLGGGEIRIGRVVQVSGQPLENDEAVFTNFVVEAKAESTEDVKASLKTKSTVEPIAIPHRQSSQIERTPEERAILKRQKRDTRRARMESSPGWLPEPPAHHYRHKDPSSPDKPRAPRPVKVVKPKMSQSAPVPKGYCALKPVPAKLDDERVRFVVEAVVLKKAGLGRRDGAMQERQSTSFTTDESEVEIEEDQEGWKFIEFDFVGAARRKAAHGGSV